MAVHKWTKLRTVLSDLSSTISGDAWEEADAMEWAFGAMRKIGAIEQYQSALSLVKIADYRGDLPKDLQRIRLVAYKLDVTSLTDDQLAAIRRDIGLDNDDYYTGFNQDGFSRSDFRPLRLASSGFSGDIFCDECENLNCASSHTFSLLPNMSVTTSFVTGSICVAYYKYAQDCDGEYLIPDDEDYLDAVRSYIMMRYWERKWNGKEDGADSRFKYYSDRWQVLRSTALGNVKMPDLNQLENIRISRNRLIPKEQWFDRGFANKTEESLRF